MSKGGVCPRGIHFRGNCPAGNWPGGGGVALELIDLRPNDYGVVAHRDPNS